MAKMVKIQVKNKIKYSKTVKIKWEGKKVIKKG